ncbi:MAG: ArsR/SmtB family transcription factor [Acidimicrobiia bacterium]
MAGDMDPLQVIAEPRRREILSLVWDEELAAGDIASRFEITFGAISQHLAVLRETGFVTVRQEGNRRLYRARKEGLGPLRAVLESMWGETLDDLATAIAREQEEPGQ